MWSRHLAAAALVPLLAACSSTSASESTGGGGSGSASGSGSGGTGTSSDAAQACVDDINADRATLNLPPYARWTDGEGCASQEAQMDSDSGKPHGAFGMCGESAQDECPGWPGPPGNMIGSCLAQMWAEGPGADFSTHGHYINMSSTQYAKVACGFYTLADGSVWAAQNFR